MVRLSAVNDLKRELAFQRASVSSYFTKHSGSSKVSGMVEILAFDLQTMNNTLEDLAVCDCV